VGAGGLGAVWLCAVCVWDLFNEVMGWGCAVGVGSQRRGKKKDQPIFFKKNTLLLSILFGIFLSIWFFFWVFE
jgi:polyferredoxin